MQRDGGGRMAPVEGGASYQPPVCRYSSIERAALRPAPMARMTVAAPVTMSPPAKTPFFEVRSVSGSATAM